MENPFGASISDATPELLDAFVRLLRLLEHPEDALVLAPMIEREILWRILTGSQGALLRQIGLADSRLFARPPGQDAERLRSESVRVALPAVPHP